MSHPLLVRVLRFIWPDVVFSIKTTDRVVALTIDDGPSVVTTDLLRVLSRRAAHATFFLLGEKVELDARDPNGSLSQLVAGGHELGNHTWRDRSTFRFPRAEFKHDLNRTHAVLAQFGDVRVFRPGGGRFRPRMLAAAKEVARDYDCVLASVYPHDVRVRFRRFIVWYVIRLAKPGAIIVLHEGEGDRAQVVTVLDEILAKLDDRGYRVTTVSELLALRSASGSSGS